MQSCWFAGQSSSPHGINEFRSNMCIILVFLQLPVGSIVPMNLSQLVNLRIMQNKVLWRTLAVAFCALVFFFALHAKTSVYNSLSAKVTPLTASKLWVTGQEMDTQAPESATGEILFWMTVLCLFGLYFHSERIVESGFLEPAPTNLPLRHLHRFLRPPPVQN
jgi:hypothetical protein